MVRAITGFHRDEEGDWVAELSCGHDQHVRHRPPFQDRPWVLGAEGRTRRLGTAIDCPLCDRAELPGNLRLVRTSPVWDEDSIPAGLRRAHRVAGGTWGRIVVQEGRLRFSMATEPPLTVEMGPGDNQPIPPDVEHEVLPLGPVRFSVEFLAVEESRRPGSGSEELETQEEGEDGDHLGVIADEIGGPTHRLLRRPGVGDVVGPRLERDEDR